MKAVWLRRATTYPVATFSLSGLGLAVLLFSGIWGSFSNLLREGHAAETQRLVEAFEDPLAEALAKGDDLAKIDQLRRLLKLPGVVTAVVNSAPQDRPRRAVTLLWEGKPVGWFNIHLSSAPWQRLRYQSLERLWTLGVLLGLAGGAIGWIFQKQKRNHLSRLERLLRRRHENHRLRQGKLRKQIEQELIPWTRQAMMLASNGLVLLDGRQGIVAWNAIAQQWLQLSPNPQGKHWLDLRTSPEWAAALQQSVDHPGIRVAGPVSETLPAITLLSWAPDATWIILQTPASHPAVSIV